MRLCSSLLVILLSASALKLLRVFLTTCMNFGMEIKPKFLVLLPPPHCGFTKELSDISERLECYLFTYLFYGLFYGMCITLNDKTQKSAKTDMVLIAFV